MEIGKKVINLYLVWRTTYITESYILLGVFDDKVLAENLVRAENHRWLSCAYIQMINLNEVLENKL